MTNRFRQSIQHQKKSTVAFNQEISGILGITMGGKKLVEVPGRNGYVYVRLRSNQNELIQAFNDKVSITYDLSVLVVWEGNRYRVVGRDSLRYTDWEDTTPYLPPHAPTHEMGGGDMVFIDSEQFLPLLTFPSGTDGGPNVIISDYIWESSTGTFQYIPAQASPDMTPWLPTGTGQAIMLLVYMEDGDIRYRLGSGSYFPSSVTGSIGVLPYVPLASSDETPLSAIRLTDETSVLTWDNIYDLRQFFGGGGGGGTTNNTYITNQLGVVGWDDGVYKGSGTIINLRGDNTWLTVSGTVIDILVSGTAGGVGPQGPTGATGPQGPVGAGNPGLWVLDEGTPLGTGTIFNFRGTPIVATISGSMIDVYVTENAGGGRTQIGSDLAPAGSTTATFSTIPGTYKVLVIEGYVKTTATLNSWEDLYIQFNGDTTASNYFYVEHIWGFDGGTYYDTPYGGANRYTVYAGVVTSKTGIEASNFTHITIRIQNYADTTPRKLAFCEWGGYSDGTYYVGGGNTRTHWANASAITQVDLKLNTGNFATGSLLRLYGEN